MQQIVELELELLDAANVFKPLHVRARLRYSRRDLALSDLGDEGALRIQVRRVDCLDAPMPREFSLTRLDVVHETGEQYAFISGFILLDDASRMAKMQEIVRNAVGEGERAGLIGAHFKEGVLRNIAGFSRFMCDSLPENEVGSFELCCVYESSKHDGWQGRVFSRPLLVQIERSGEIRDPVL